MTKQKANKKPKSKSSAAVGRPSQSAEQRKSKAAICIDLLKRKGGASIDDLKKATGWRSHSVRGFLSGKIKKTAGLKLTSEKSADGVRRYHVQSI